MANKIVEINVKVNGLDTIKGQVDELQTKLESLGEIELINDEADNKIKKLTKSTKELGETSKKSGNSIGDIAKGFGLMKVGEAILGKITDLFMQNADVARVMEIANRALSIVFKDLFNFIKDNIGAVATAVTDFGTAIIDTFSKPKVLLDEFGKLIKENIEERISSAIDLFGYLASSVKKVFSGDFAGAMEDAKKAGKEFIDTQTGINNSFDRTVKGVGDAVDATGKFISEGIKTVKNYAGSVADLATKQVDAANSAKLIQKQQQIIVDNLQSEIEKQKQLADDTSRSVKDRIASNNELVKLINQQEAAQLKAANAAIQVAKDNVALNATIDNQTALLDALDLVSKAHADAEGKRSEQKARGYGLENGELKTLNQTAINGIAERAIAEKEFTAGLIEDTTDRLDAQRIALVESQKLEEERLNEIIKNSNEGTQVRADAEQAVLKSRQDLNQKLITNEREKNKTILAENEQTLNATIANEANSFEVRFAALDQQLILINSKKYASEADHTAAVKANTDARLNLQKTELEGKLAFADAIGAISESISTIAKEGSAEQKALAVAGAIISTYTAIAGQLAAASASPSAVIPGYAIAQAIATGVFGLLQVKKIIQTKVPGDKGGSAPSTPLQPTFNLNGQNNNQNTTAAPKSTEVNTQTGNITVKAYVSETELTQKQGFIKKVGESAKI